ncbi:MAG: hypothetical protein H6741_34640 [Alphaproteobacteria bacterium]|nr:hypothetical protein [Alphaproteobacteria bacterium]
MRHTTTAIGCALLGLSAAFAPVAFAGGLGVIATGGLHQENIYVYDSYDISSPDTEQTIVYQQRPTYGFGIVGVLGDRDDRVQGLMKAYYLADTAPTSSGVVDAAEANGAVAGTDGLIFTLPREEGDTRHLGIATAGVQWGILPDPGALQLVANTSLGAGVLTTDSTEFLIADVGLGATYSLSESLVLAGDVAYNMRIRKSLYHNANVNVGIRFMFD